VLPVQVVAQLPQCAAVSMLVRQPAAGLLQAANPGLHVGLQALAVHTEAVAFWVWHWVPQLPQLAALALVSTSQSVPFWLQSANGAVQVLTLQAEASHLAVAWAIAQGVPHFPQLLKSEVMLVSQPSFTAPLQSPWAESHVATSQPVAPHFGVP
jgi:hypothetical protein